MTGPGPAGAADTQELVSFVLHDALFGVPLARVQEVVRTQPLTPVPLAPPALAGLMNLRGEVVPALDLRRRLGWPPGPPEPTNLVLRTATGPVSLLVDRVVDVVVVDPSAVQSVPQTVDPSLRGLVTGSWFLGAGLLLGLDVDAAVELSDAPAAPPPALTAVASDAVRMAPSARQGARP